MPTLKKLSLSLLGLFSLMAMGEWFNAFATVDTQAYTLGLRVSSPGLDNAINHVAALGGTTVIGIWLLGLLAVGWWRRGLLLLIVTGVAVLIAGELLELLCKTVIVHPGPVGRILDLGSVPVATPGSFPSGHTLRVTVVSVITAMALSRSWPEKGKIWWALALIAVAAVSAARVYLADHWLSDVVGSWLLAGGLLSGGLAIGPGLISRLQRKTT